MMVTEKGVECASCKNNLVSYTGKSEVLVCPKCGNALLVSMGQTFISGKVFSHPKEIDALIPLGYEITIQKTTYRVVGIASYKEAGKPYSWLEYTIYNETIGFLTLSSFKNTFNLVRQIHPAADEILIHDRQNIAFYQGKTFNLYNKYDIEVKYAEGEFQYNISRVNDTTAMEYLNPPQLLITHDRNAEKHYFIAEYVNPKEIGESLGKHVPVGTFTNPTETYIKGFRPSTAIIAYMIFLLLLCVAAIFQKNIMPEEKIFEESYIYYPGSSEKNPGVITPSFELTNLGSSLTVELTSDISNDWFVMGFDLINETNNNTISFENGVEYYSGTTDGESWTEGSRDNDVNITNIKPGKYHLVMYPIFSEKKASLNTTFKVYKNRLFTSNYVIIGLLAALFPLIYMYLEYTLDRKRWYYSDYSKYTYNE